MRLPFSEAQFLDVFGAYNMALWPAVILLWGWTFVATARLFAGRNASASLSLLAAVHWGWAAVAYHALFFARINPAARIFAALFMLQAFGFLQLVVRHQPRFALGGTPRQQFAAALLASSLLYPALVLLSGFELPRAPIFAVPCPTVLFTGGLLLAAETPVHRSLFVIPILWSLIAGSAAVLFGVIPDLMLFGAAAGLVAAMFSNRFVALGQAAMQAEGSVRGRRS
jgi:hypothetical protein